MDKVYMVWRIERYEGKDILGVFKTKDRAREFAQTYMKESVYTWEPDEVYTWEPDDWHDDAWYCGAMDVDLRVEAENVLP